MLILIDKRVCAFFDSQIKLVQAYLRLTTPCTHPRRIRHHGLRSVCPGMVLERILGSRDAYFRTTDFGTDEGALFPFSFWTCCLQFPAAPVLAAGNYISNAQK